MKGKKKLLTLILVAVMAFICAGFTACGDPEASAILLKQAPTVTSKYNESLAIADDGVIRVKYVSGDVADVKITLRMIDQAGFNNKSLSEQTLKIKYGGQDVAFSFKLIREASVISIKKAPTVTSGYTDMPFTIATDGVLSVTYADGGVDELTITDEMLDLTDFDILSSAEQNVKISYGGKTTTFKVTLIDDELDDTGTLQSFRFEAEDADFGGGTVDTELCGSEGSGYLKRADDSIDECLKNFFLGEGGYVNYNIICSKRTHVTITMSIGTQGFSAKPDFDKYARLIINGVSTLTGIVYNSSVPTYGVSPWWVFQDYQVTTEIVLKRGLNTVTVASYGYAGITLEEGDNAPQAGGKNLSWLEFSTTGTLSWAT